MILALHKILGPGKGTGGDWAEAWKISTPREVRRLIASGWEPDTSRQQTGIAAKDWTEWGAADQPSFFFRSLVCDGLSPIADCCADWVDVAAFLCLLASIAFFRFSGNPRFFAALLLALV